MAGADETTGVLEFNAAIHSLQSGVADYLVKPFPRERLTDALHRACFVHRSRRAVTDMQRELDERRAHIAAALEDLEINAAALPDQILIRKERSLSADERATLRSYPLHGQAMLKNVPFLAAASEIAVAAHERYDDSGFPRGLKGEAIPQGVRIMPCRMCGTNGVGHRRYAGGAGARARDHDE